LWPLISEISLENDDVGIQFPQEYIYLRVCINPEEARYPNLDIYTAFCLKQMKMANRTILVCDKF